MPPKSALFDPSKLAYDNPVRSIIDDCKVKKRKFVQGIDLQCYLKNLGKSNTRYAINATLPFDIKKVKIVLIGSVADNDTAKAMGGIETTTIDELKVLKQKKGRALKNYFKVYDFVIASKDIMPQVSKLFGMPLARMGKFPIGIQTTVQDAIKDLDKNLRMAQKKSLCLSGRIGSATMSESELKTNLTAAIGNILAVMPKGYDNLKTIYAKPTMGKPVLLYKK